MIHVNNFSNGALNPGLSYVVSCVGCFLGLRCTTRARAYQGAARARWLTLAALSIGTTGIWVMHFIAMLGFAIQGETIRYNVPFTILSMVIAVLVVGIGTFIVGFSRARATGRCCSAARSSGSAWPACTTSAWAPCGCRPR